MEPNYTQILIQWLFFFALMSVIFLPAFLFRKIAIRHHKKGWLFFLFGLAVGVLALNIGRLALYPFTRISIADEYKPYITVVLFIVGYAVIFVAVTLLKEKFNPKDSNDSLDAE